MNESLFLAVQIAAYSSLAHLFIVRPLLAIFALISIACAEEEEDGSPLAKTQVALVKIVFVPYVLLTLLAIILALINWI